MTRLTITVSVLLLTAGNAIGQVRAVPGGQQVRTASSRAVHEPFVEPITATKIRTAIDDAVMYLRSQQAEDGSIGESNRSERSFGGPTALAALTMLAAGGHPASDDQLNSALDWLAKLEPNNTYVAGSVPTSGNTPCARSLTTGASARCSKPISNGC